MEPMEAAVGGKAVDAYRKALATAASAAAYAVMARSMARELLPEELRAAARWAASALGARVGWGQRDRRTLVVRSQPSSTGAGADDNLLFEAARTYLASRLDPRAMRRLGVTLARARDDAGRASWRRLLFLEPGGSTFDDFEGVRFTWTCVEPTSSGGAGGGGSKKKAKKGGEPSAGGDRDFVLELSFDAQHTDVAMDRYVPFVMGAAEEVEQRERALKICMNEGRMWYRMSLHHPATFETLAMDPALKRSIVADLDLFKSRRDHYRRVGKAWKRGYLLYGPPGTGKSSLVAAMANHLRYNLFDLDLSHVQFNTSLQWLLVGISDKSILVIEDIDCCCDAVSRKDDKAPPVRTCGRKEDDGGDDDIDDGPAPESGAPPPRTAPPPNKSNSNQVTKLHPFKSS
jgi:chaperone BCS1